MSTLIPNNGSDDITRALEMERKLGEFVYNYLISEQCQAPETAKKLLQRFKPEEYGYNSFLSMLVIWIYPHWNHIVL